MSNAAIPQAPPTENIYGMAKRISLDLEKLPLHTHAAVINIVNTMCQHRKLVLETDMQVQQMAAQEAAMADARKAHAEQQVRREAEITRQIADAAQPKAPRLSIVLGDSEPASDATGFVEQPSAEDLDAVEAEKRIAAETLTEEVPA